MEDRSARTLARAFANAVGLAIFAACLWIAVMSRQGWMAFAGIPFGFGVRALVWDATRWGPTTSRARRTLGRAIESESAGDFATACYYYTQWAAAVPDGSEDAQVRRAAIARLWELHGPFDYQQLVEDTYVESQTGDESYWLDAMLTRIQDVVGEDAYPTIPQPFGRDVHRRTMARPPAPEPVWNASGSLRVPLLFIILVIGLQAIASLLLVQGDAGAVAGCAITGLSAALLGHRAATRTPLWEIPVALAVGASMALIALVARLLLTPTSGLAEFQAVLALGAAFVVGLGAHFASRAAR